MSKIKVEAMRKAAMAQAKQQKRDEPKILSLKRELEKQKLLSKRMIAESKRKCEASNATPTLVMTPYDQQAFAAAALPARSCCGFAEVLTEPDVMDNALF